ncbi:hypothetical protein Tco_0053213 [Tanacetum coccineum]
MADILKKFDFVTVKTASTLIKTNKALLKDEEAEDVDVHLYRSMIESLMYLTASRPDIMFAVCAYARFQVTPKDSHLRAVKRIFRYLKGQPKLGLWYPWDSPFDLEAFSDSNYARASLDRKSTTGGCQFLSKVLISWQCKKQTIVSNSTTEAEYVATANCCGQVLWIQNQMLDYGFNFMNTKIYIDNESTICIVKNPVFHSKTKHIEIRHHFIRDSYEKRLIQVIKIHTDHNVADLLTKALIRLCLTRDGTAADYEIQVSTGLELKDKKELAILGQTMTGKEFSNPLMAGSLPKTISAKLKDLPEPFNDTYETPSHTKKVFSNMARQSKGFSGKVTPLFDSMLVQNHAPEGEVSMILQTEAHSESQKLSSPSTYQRKHKKTQKHRRAKLVTELPQTSVPLDLGADESVHKEGTRSKRVLKQPNKPPLSEGRTSRSGEGKMEHTFELMDIVPPIPHDSPLPGGYTPRSDEGRLELEELMVMCIKLSKPVLDLEKEKDAQAVEILNLKKRVKKLERQRKSSMSHPRMRIYRQVESSDDDLDEEDATKQGRISDKIKPMFKDNKSVLMI